VAKSTDAEIGLTAGPSLRRNTAVNVVGQALPIAFAVVAIPTLIGLIGIGRFGILSLCWVILGYAAMVDLGLGRATAKIAAEAIARNERMRLGSVVLTSFFMHGTFGTLAGLVFWAASGFIVARVINPSPLLLTDASDTLELLALALPFVLLGNAARSVLEAAQRFDLTNAVAIPSSALTYGLPVLGAALGLPFPDLVLLVVANRAAMSLLYLLLAMRQVPEARANGFSRNTARQLLGFGGWVSVSNLALPLLVYGDRFVASSVIGVATLGYYSAPADAITRLWVIPAAVAPVIFPALVGSAARGDRRFVHIYSQGLSALVAFIGPVIWASVLLSNELMRGWLGPAVGGEAAPLLRVLAVGVLAGTLGYIPVTVLQAIGRPDLPAKYQLAQVVPFLALATYLAGQIGLVGVAVAWTTRTIVDLALGLTLVQRVTSERSLTTQLMVLIAGALLVTAALTIPIAQDAPIALRVTAVIGCAALAAAATLRALGFRPLFRET
jgi:O-antigen/teichoic acid export membrane protein